jgi:hypothetical protein
MKFDVHRRRRAREDGTLATARDVLPPMRPPNVPRHRGPGLPIIAIAVVVLVVTACTRDAGGSPSTGSDRPSRTDVPAEPVPSASAPAMTGEVPVTILGAILQDATERTGVSLGDLAVSRAEAVTFSDGSLDCPEPGMSYTQALVDGYQVEIEAGDETLDYRVGAGGSFRLCESDGPPGGG